MLAALLLDAEHVVPAHRLIEAVWDERPPANAQRALSNVVYRLRRALAPAAESDMLRARAGGYLLTLSGAEYDAAEFERELAEATRLIDRAEQDKAAQTLRRALARWRGPALSGLGGAIFEAAAVRWDELRLNARISLADILTDTGRPEHAVTELAALVTEHPLRENVVSSAMSALYFCGQQRDALDLYTGTRRRLLDELGIEPSPALRDLQGRILNNDLGRAVRVNVVPSATPSPAVPQQLPAAPRHFVGRKEALKVLDQLLDGADPTERAEPRIAVIDGIAGTGKTALAIHWAHHAAAQFPDGQLYANLRGFGPGAEPLLAHDVIGGFLRALGMPPEKIAADPTEKVNQYRSALSRARVMLVLDNARDAQQVRPLLPGAASCMTVVTSRDRLLGLVASEGAEPVSLDVFTHEESREFLTRRLGPQTAGGEPREMAELIELGARLPLALSIIAARATLSQRAVLRPVVEQLRETRSRLDALGTGDEATDPRIVFSWSYRSLSAPAAVMFELLAVHPGLEIGARAVRSLAGDLVPDVGHALAELVRAHLIEEPRSDRFTIHDLLRRDRALSRGRPCPRPCQGAERIGMVQCQAGGPRARTA